MVVFIILFPDAGLRYQLPVLGNHWKQKNGRKKWLDLAEHHQA